MHLVAPEVASGTGIPLIHIIDETAAALRAKGLKRPLLLATRYTMEHGFYAQRMRGLGIEVMVPDDEGRTAMQDIIFRSEEQTSELQSIMPTTYAGFCLKIKI